MAINYDLISGGLETSRSYDWKLTGLKTANYQAIINDNIPCDTSGGEFTITLPNIPAGRVRVFDVAGNASIEGFGVNSLMVVPYDPEEQTIMGDSSLELDVGASALAFEMVGGDWRIVGGTTSAVSTEPEDYVLPSTLFRWLTIALSDNITPVGPSNNVEYYQVQEDMTIQSLWFTTPAQAPTGSSAIVAIKANGVNIFATNPTIVAGSTTSGALVPTTTNIPAGAVLTFNIIQVGAINTGLGYRVTMKTVGG